MPDYIVFGASGFTGKYACFRLAQLQKENPKLTFGIAGRSESKLQKLSKALNTEYDCENFEIFIADVNKPDTLENICCQCKVVLNAVGPYRFWGEPVVKACAKSGTHYVDICGEPEFILHMMEKYHEIAQASGALIVHSCGFDSVPAEYGAWLCEQYFEQNSAKCHEVTCFHEQIWPSDRRGFEPVANSATFVALIESFSNAGALKKKRKALEEKPYFTGYRELKRDGSKPKVHSGWFASPSGKHSFKFMGADSAVVRAGQGLRDSLCQKQFGDSPPQPYFTIYSSVGSFWQKLFFSLWGLFFYLCVSIKFLHPYMKAHPRFFTWGVFSNGDIRREMLEKSMVNLTIYGKGKSANGKPFASVGSFLIKDPGYSSTANIMVACAETLLQETDQILKGDPGKNIPAITGGVLTPAVVFANTLLSNRLKAFDLSWNFRQTDS